MTAVSVFKKNDNQPIKPPVHFLSFCGGTHEFFLGFFWVITGTGGSLIPISSERTGTGGPVL
jgi:hypothetical protein